MIMIVVFLCNYDLFAIAPGIKVEEHYLATAIAMKSKNEHLWCIYFANCARDDIGEEVVVGWSFRVGDEAWQMR